MYKIKGKMTLKKYMLAIMLLLILASGCQSPFAETMVLLEKPIAEVNLSKSNGFGEINDDFIFKFNDDETIKVFEKAILSAEKIGGKSNRTVPDYDLVVVYEGGLPSHAIYLWLGNEDETSTMKYLTDEEVAYVTSAKTTNQLRELLISK